MSVYRTQLLGAEQVAERTMAFHFEKPAGFSFRAGQAIDVTLPALAKSGQTARHAFSLVNAPDEARLTIATRLRGSAYKEVLRSMTPGAVVEIEGPFGSLTLHKNAARSAVLIAGGIGITPFVSILREAARQRQERQIVLFHSNRRAEDAAYLDELLALAGDYPSLRVIPTLTQTDAISPTWSGRSGRIDGALLASVAAKAPIYYLAGPPSFVEAMQAELTRQGADEDDIRSEGFYGY